MALGRNVNSNEDCMEIFQLDRKGPPQSHTTASFGLYTVLLLFYPTGGLTPEKQ